MTEHAVGAGAELLQPPTDMLYEARQTIRHDPFGHIWIFFGSPIVDVLPAVTGDRLARLPSRSGHILQGISPEGIRAAGHWIPRFVGMPP